MSSRDSAARAVRGALRRTTTAPSRTSLPQKSGVPSRVGGPRGTRKGSLLGAGGDGFRFLHADSRGLGIQAGRKVEWDLEAYPVLAWSWRPRQFPDGADERRSKTNDSLLAVYAVFPQWIPGTVRSVKYIWSAVVPMGTHLSSIGGRTQVLVLRAGTEGKDQWVEERVTCSRTSSGSSGLRASPSRKVSRR